MDQSSNKVANPARGQLKQGKRVFPCPRSRLRICFRETGSAVVPSRVSLLIFITRRNMLLAYGIPLPSSAAAAYRRTIERKAAASMKAKRRKTKQHKTDVTLAEKKDNMASSANQPPGGDTKFAPLVVA